VLVEETVQGRELLRESRGGFLLLGRCHFVSLHISASCSE
jgi:hypothetical protein